MKRAAALLQIAALVAALSVERAARAHGGLPVTQKILRIQNGDTMYVPVVFWGLWVGGPGNWHWICEEEINANRGRRFAVSSDGAFYATDLHGLTVSLDKGCTWKPLPSSSPPEPLKITDVDVDPQDGATAYITSADTGAPDADGMIVANNALWVTHDHAASFAPAVGLAAMSDRLFQSVRVAPQDGLTIYVTSTAPMPPFDPRVHKSIDGGMTFTSQPIPFTLDGTVPYDVELMAIDPRDATVIYARAYVAALDPDGGEIVRQVLLRSIDSGATFAAVTQIDSVVSASGIARGIDGVAIDVPRGKVYVATAGGLLAGDDAGRAPVLTLGKTGSLSQSQCVDVHNGTVYACASNFAPDLMAIAQSTDGAMTFSKALEFVDTIGPVNCPSGTPVGDVCPLYWEMYGSQLGINFPDGGTSDGGVVPPKAGGCACDVGGAAGTGVGLALGFALGCALLIAFKRRRA